VKILELCSKLHATTKPKNHPGWLRANLKILWSKEIWAPSSPGYNPLDYFMWSEVARKVSKHPHKTMASLRAQISEVMAYIDREAVICPCKKFWSRKGAVVEASGNFKYQINV
jgi:hypothetical protein